MTPPAVFRTGLFSVFLLLLSSAAAAAAARFAFKKLHERTAAWIVVRDAPVHAFVRILNNRGISPSYGAGSERTLAIVKPDGVSSNHAEKIKKIILASGFRILREKTVQLDEESAATFYSEHSKKKFFHSLVQYMTSGPVLVMVLDKENAIADWRMLIGPTDSSKAKITHPRSIRAMCGTDAEKNCVHGSDSDQSVQREISFFFASETSGVDNVGHDEL